MGASGTLESIACIKMLQHNTLLPTKNLKQVDERCAPLQYNAQLQNIPLNIIMKNSFAIGGNNCSLLLRRPL